MVKFTQFNLHTFFREQVGTRVSNMIHHRLVFHTFTHLGKIEVLIHWSKMKTM